MLSRVQSLVSAFVNRRYGRLLWLVPIFLGLLAASSPAQAQNRLSISTSLLDAPGATVPAGQNFRYRVSYSCDLVSLPSCNSAVVTVDLPPELEFVGVAPAPEIASSSHDGSALGGTVTLTFNPAVPAGNTGDVDITVRFPNGSTADGTVTTNLTGAATSTGTGLTTQTVDLPAVTATAETRIALGVSLQNGFIDDCPSMPRYVVSVGPDSAFGSLDLIDVQQLVLTLPTGVTNVSANDGGVFDAVANTVTWTSLGVVQLPNSLSVSVDLTFADPPFSDGDMVTVLAEATAQGLGEPTAVSVAPQLFTATLSRFTEDPDARVTKRFGDGRPNGLPPAEGQDFSFAIRARNTGNIPLDSMTVIDDGDGLGADIDGAIEINTISSGAYSAGYNGLVTVSITTNLSPLATLGSSPGNANATFTPTLLAGERVTGIQWDFAGPIPVGMNASTPALVSATLSAGFPPGTSVENRARISWTATRTGICFDPPGPASGNGTPGGITFTVGDPYSYLRPRKNETTSGPYFPGNTVSFGLEITNEDLANDAAPNPVVTDLLPEFLAFAPASQTFADNGTGVTLASPGDFEVIPNYNGTGRTLLRWNLTGDLDPGETVDISFDTTVETGVIFGNLTNRVGMTYNGSPVVQVCAGATATDAADLDGDGSDTDVLCVEDEGVTIAAVAQLSSAKLVSGQCDATFAAGPATGTTLPSGLVDWRVRVQNVQTVPITNFVIVDIFPALGDTGVRDLTPRLSLFRPLLVNPITPPPGGAVFYSLSSNPCRPEVGGPTTGCDAPNWTTVPPVPLTDTRAVRIDFGSRVLNPLDVLEFSWPMVVPADAPTDGSEAFNSFAFGSNRQDDGGFLAAEPNKVGVDAACVPPADAMLGNFVFLDADSDGVQDAGEGGLNDIQVQLFQPGPDGLPRTGDDVLLLTTVTANDSSGDPGWYKFSALDAGDYYVQVTPPLNFGVSPQDAGGDEALDSDADPTSACTDVVALAISENNPDIDVGLVVLPTASLGNYVWFDLNGDGQQNEAQDRGLNGVTVRLFADDGDGTPEPFGHDGTPLEVTVTDDDAFGAPGFYLFEDLIPGVSYFVQFVEPSPATGFTTRNSGSDLSDSDASQANGTSQVITLAPGENNPTLDAGVVLADGPLSLGNVVWCDDDGNGVIDAAGDDDGLYDPLVPEAALNGVRVNLYLDVNTNGNAEVDEFVATTMTQTLAGKDGRYRFDALPAGDYLVEIDASNFEVGGPFMACSPSGVVSSSGNAPTPDPDDDADNDDNGDPSGAAVISAPVTLTEDGEPTPDADDDIEDDDNINFSVDFGFIPGAPPALDFGDNPDAGAGTGQGNYRTVDLDGGAAHFLTGASGPFLGACVDSDGGSLQNAGADADDQTGAAGVTFGTCATGGDDEDGVTFSSTLLSMGGTFDLTVTSGSATPCVINGFIDWNRNGSFLDAGEQILTDAAAGAFPGLAVPATATPGFTYARFRCSSAGGDGPDGEAPNGEVEDYRLRVIGADWGDAPDAPYGTLASSGGANHATNPTIELYLGSCVDTEGDGQPSFGADADDLNLGDSRIGDCVDDEDGVVFGGMLVRGATVPITVTASMPGRLDAWIDFDGVNGFAGPSDQILTNVSVAAGANGFTFTVPPLADPGISYARFRYSTAGGLAATGPAADGEVEDYRVLIKAFDFGDAPDSPYGTLLGSGGAQHVVDPNGTVYLGPPAVGCADVENDGAPNAAANGDDLAGTLDTNADAGLCDSADDEDGVVFNTMIIACQQAQITVNAAGPGRLDAWIDYDRSAGNGFAGAADQIFTNRGLTAGANVLTVNVPCTAQIGDSYARFRYSSAGSLSPVGLAMDGEVEDYPVLIKGVDFGDAADTFGTTFGAGGPTHGVDPTASTPLLLGACVDTEVEARTPLDTTGDDVSAGTGTVGTCAVANDDEDGVVFTSMVIGCQDATLEVTASAAGVLDAWIDFGGDGTFTAPSDRIFSGQGLSAGVNSLTFSAPCAVSPGTVQARFRLSSVGVAGPGGPSMDGEVEDYEIRLKGADLGDAPDTYPTTEASNGPSHGVDTQGVDLFLGACVDTETAAGTPLDGTGDDVTAPGTSTDGTCGAGNDDEDGVVFDTMLIACQNASLTVTASAAGLLDAWIDFTGDGTFGQAGEQIFASEAVTAGANARTLSVPCTATPATTYARFRFSSAGGLGPAGPAMDGEVEDYPVTLKGSDFGDAPDTYGTADASGGPKHGVDPAGTLFLGACVDTELDAATPLDATGDDVTVGTSVVGTCAAAGDDEDGIVFDTMLIACQDASFTVTAGAAGVLDAWLDFAADGTFAQAGDRIFTGQAVAAGSTSLTFTVPCDAARGTTYARFRLSSAGVASPGGAVMDGEVEDYAVTLKGTDFGDAPDTYGTTFAQNGARHGVDPAEGRFLGVCVDVETDAETPLDATGDDVTSGLSEVGTCAADDDEDGVSFDTMIIACGDADVTVTASLAGQLDAWIDFAADGSFAEAEDRIFSGQAVTAGSSTLTFTVPCGVTPGSTFARFRYTSAGAPGPTGPAMDGEVEDYEVTLKGSDFGDAPDTYGTTDAAGGAAHGVDVLTPYHLGACVDTETDASAPLDATGDDAGAGTSTAGTCGVANDDEDGVTFDTMIAACRDSGVTVTASGAGLLDAWIDFGADGVFDAADRIFTGQAVAAGANALSFNAPCDAAPGASFARFRFSSTGVSSPTGDAMDGEVEDYEVTLKGVDFGDNPDTYQTTFAATGPLHTVDPNLNLYLGACVDTESDAATPLDASGDDLGVGSSTVGTCGAPGDDEDGVVFETLITACKGAELTVTASAAGLLDAWIDFGADGDFGAADDQIASSLALAAGANTVSFTVPCTAADGTTYARFRFSSGGGLAPTGPADDGEVEDYELTSDEVDFGDAPDTYQTTFAAGGPVHGLDPVAGLYLGACVDSESEGQPGLGADGDDLGSGFSELGTCGVASDDEDGVTFNTALASCQQADLTVVASASGLLDGWIDLDGDGTFSGPNDRVFASQAIGAGANPLSITLPCGVAPGVSYARFRFSSIGGLGFGGTTPNGEVEDYRVELIGSDLGDVPDTYSTTEAVNGASHAVDPLTSLYLGACVDTELDGQPSVLADGDDSGAGTGTVGTCIAANDDEDGVTFDTLVNVCLPADVTVTAAAPGVLDAWLDLDGDGTFNGPADRIFAGTALVAGANSLTFTVPCDATPGESYARFRFSTAGVPSFDGPAADGEVEDYPVLVAGFDFGDAPDPTYPTLLGSDGARHIVLVAGNPVLGASVDIE
ncbi:MAG: GEVED domain-containing protein, partial [Acidobacteriota bacterium]